MYTLIYYTLYIVDSVYYIDLFTSILHSLIIIQILIQFSILPLEAKLFSFEDFYLSGARFLSIANVVVVADVAVVFVVVGGGVVLVLYIYGTAL